jgi:hypothetical protein
LPLPDRNINQKNKALDVFLLFEINQPNANAASGLGAVSNGAGTKRDARRPFRVSIHPSIHRLSSECSKARPRIEFRLLADFISGKLSVAKSVRPCLEIRCSAAPDATFNVLMCQESVYTRLALQPGFSSRRESCERRLQINRFIATVIDADGRVLVAFLHKVILNLQFRALGVINIEVIEVY